MPLDISRPHERVVLTHGSGLIQNSDIRQWHQNIDEILRVTTSSLVLLTDATRTIGVTSLGIETLNYVSYKPAILAVHIATSPLIRPMVQIALRLSDADKVRLFSDFNAAEQAAYTLIQTKKGAS